MITKLSIDYDMESIDEKAQEEVSVNNKQLKRSIVSTISFTSTLLVVLRLKRTNMSLEGGFRVMMSNVPNQ